MSGFRPRQWLLGAAALIGVSALAAAWGTTPNPPVADQDSFVAESRVAMARMMAGLDIPPSGNGDSDFATMMIAHHQGAIAMARVELGHGHDERLRRIAQGIIVEQQQEIEAMRLAAGDAAPALPGPLCTSFPRPVSAPVLTQHTVQGDVVHGTP